MPETETKQEKKEEVKEQEIDKNKKYSWEDVHDLREENKQERKRREAAEKLAHDAETRLKDLDDKEKAAKQKELEAQGKFKELAEAKEKEIASLREANKRFVITSNLKMKAVELGLSDLDGLSMIHQDDLGKLTVDEQGNVSGIDELLKSFKEKKPYLFGKVAGTVKTNAARPGGESGGKRVYKRSDIQNMDPKTYEENRFDILAAQREGRILEG